MSYDTNLRAAVRDLIAAKGRYHTGIEYVRLVAAFNAASDEIANRSETMSDTSNMTRFDSSMTREQVAEKMHHIIKPDPIYDARCALQDKTDWSSP